MRIRHRRRYDGVIVLTRASGPRRDRRDLIAASTDYGATVVTVVTRRPRGRVAAVAVNGAR